MVLRKPAVPIAVAPPRPASFRPLGLTEWVSPTGLGGLNYSALPRYRVVAGEPRCHRECLRDLIREFESECRRERLRILYFGLPGSLRQCLDPEGRRGSLHIGDLPVFDLRRWVHRRLFPPAVQSQIRRVERRGVRARFLKVAPTETHALRSCLRSWLLGKGMPPLRFLTDPFLLNPWPDQGVWAAEARTGIPSFLTWSRSEFHDLWRIDIIARAPGAPNGCAELVVASAFQAAALQGHSRITLGLAPLARRSATPPQYNPAWFRGLAYAARRWGTPWYSFAGLETFKAKFRPDFWEPVFCVGQHPAFTAQDGAAMLRAFTEKPLWRYGWEAAWWRVGRRSTRSWPL